MAYFGGSVAQCLYTWNMSAREFDDPVGGAVPNGEAIIAAALTRAEAQIKSMLPERALALLSRIEGEIIVPDADSGQTTASLTYSATTTSQVTLWKFSAGQVMVNQLYKASSYKFTDYTIASKKTLTLTTALEASEVLVASYGVNLINDCPSLQSTLYDFAAVELLVTRYPEMRETWLAKVEGHKAFFAAMRNGDAMLAELSTLTLVVETEQTRGASAFTYRNPA